MVTKGEKAIFEGLYRSVCPVACMLEIFGDKWTMLVVRDLFLGAKRFKDFEKAPERIPTNILTDRLNRLVDFGVVEKQLPKSGGKRFEYQLTEKGVALKPVLLSMRDWGLQWVEGTTAKKPGEVSFV